MASKNSKRGTSPLYVETRIKKKYEEIGSQENAGLIPQAAIA